MCHHNDHYRAYEHNDYGDQRRYEQHGYSDQKRHEQAFHGSSHWMWFLFLFFPFFAFHAWNASSILFWVAPVILFTLGMKAAFCTSHRQKAVAMPKDVPFYTSLSPRSDEQDAHPLLLEPDAQEDVAQQEWMQQGEQEVYASPFADEQPHVSYPSEISTQERVLHL